MSRCVRRGYGSLESRNRIPQKELTLFKTFEHFFDVFGGFGKHLVFVGVGEHADIEIHESLFQFGIVIDPAK